MKKQTSKKAFTLVELLIVVGIIGMLAGLLFPVIGRVGNTGAQMKSLNNAKNIVQSWMNYTKSGQKMRIVSAPDIWSWAGVLAERAELNTPQLWILDGDPQVQERLASSSVAMPVAISNRVGTNWQLNPEFKAFPISWAVANKTDSNADSTVPILWTRGLRPTGAWDEEAGVFRKDGGHIAFADGRVEWFKSLRDENTQQGILRVYGETSRTFNIAQAIRGGNANILSSEE